LEDTTTSCPLRTARSILADLEEIVNAGNLRSRIIFAISIANVRLYHEDTKEMTTEVPS
jgi:hypothetical protein